MTAIASLHRIGGRREQFVVKERQGFFSRRREAFLYGLANPREPLDPGTQLLQLAQRGLCPTTPIKQGVNVVHEVAQFTQMGQTTGDGHKPLTLGPAQPTFDEQKALLKEVTD